MVQPRGHPGALSSRLMLNKIREWEGGRAARAKRAVQDLFNQAEAQLGEADPDAMQEERAEAPGAADAH
jgi:hypothetical protein